MGFKLYDEHIRVLNNYDEGNGSEKKGPEAFVNAFDSILESIKNNGFDESITLIPIGKNNEPLDGAHRLAAALIYNKNIKTIKFDEAEVNYNYIFFTDRGLDSLDNKYSDAIAYEYCKLKSNTYIIMLFPSAVGKRNETRSILRKYGDIVYEKDIIIGSNGPKNLTIQLCKNEKRLGDVENNYQGADEKFNSCFQGHNPLSVFLFETRDFKNVFEAKQEIGALYNIDKQYAHSSDTHEDTIRLAQLLFNENSIHFLNNANPYDSNPFSELLNKYKKKLSEQEVNTEYFCLDTSSTIAAYGIRKASSLGFLYYGDECISLEENVIINSNNEELIYLTETKDDIIFNPENHFYFDGIKFASLEVAKKLKKMHGDIKDMQKIRLIDKYLDAKSCSFKFRVFLSYSKKVARKILKRIVKIIHILKTCYMKV